MADIFSQEKPQAEKLKYEALQQEMTLRSK